MKGWVVAAVVAGAVGVGTTQFVLKPMVLEAAPTMIESAIAEHVQGSVHYDALDISWAGDAIARGLVVRDDTGRLVARIPELRVSWSLYRAIAYALGQREAVSIIDGVVLETPELVLHEEADHSWNVTRLIRPSETNSNSQIQAKVVINHGRVRLEFFEQPSVQLDDVEALVNLEHYPEIAGDVRFAYDQRAVHIKGQYIDASHFQADILADQLPLVLGARFIPADIPAKIEGGYVTRVDAHVQGTDQGLSYHGTAEIRDGQVRYQNYHVANVNGKVQAENHRISIYDAALDVNEQPFVVQGTVDLAHVPVWDVDIRTTGAHIDRLADVPLSGPIAAHVHLGGTLEAPHAEGIAAINEGSWEGTPIRNTWAKFGYHDGVVHVEKAVVGMGSGTLHGTGYYNVKAGAGGGQWQGKQIDLSALPVTGYTLSGIADTAGSVAWKDARLTSLQAVIDGNDIGINGCQMDTLHAAAELVNGVWIVPYARAMMGGGSIAAEGRTDESGIQFHAAGVPMDRLANLLQVDMAGELSADGSIWDPTGDIRIQATVSARNGQVRGMAFDTIYGEVAYHDQTLSLMPLHWEDGKGAHVATGSVAMGGPLDLHIQSDQMRVESLLKAAMIDVPITGWYRNELYVRGTVAHPEVRGSAHLWDGSVMGELYQSATVDYRYEADTLHLDRAFANMYNGSLYASGDVRSDGMDVRFRADHIDVDRVLRERNEMNLAGYLQAQGRIYGSPSNPILTASITGDSLSLQGDPIDELYTDVAYQNGAFLLQNGFARQQDGTYRFHGRYDMNTKQIEGQAQVAKVDIADLIRVARVPIDDLHGVLRGDVRLGGTIENPSLSVKGEMESGTLGDKPIGKTVMDVSYADRKATVRQLRINVGEGMLAARGEAAWDGDIHMQVAARDFDVSYLAALAKYEGDVQGRLNMSAMFQGKTRRPQMDMSFELNEGRYQGMTFNRAIGLINLRDNMITVNQTLLQRDPYQLSMYGTIPVAALTKEGRSTNPSDSMNLQIRLDKADLNILTAVSPLITSAAGETKGQVNISGTLADPRVDGRIYIDAGTMTLKTMAAPMTKIKAHVDFAGKEATWDGAFEMGGGDLKTHGQVKWRSLTDMNYEGTLQTQKLNPKSTYFNGPLDADLHLGSHEGYPYITGRVDIHDTRLDIPFTMETSEGGAPVYLDVDVHVGNKVRLYNSYLYDLYLTGDIHAGGTTETPAMSGKLQVTKGYLKYMSSKFKINEGVAEFGRSNSFLPYLSVNAVTKFNRYRIQMNATGLPTALDLKLTSEPALTEEEIITMLTLHTDGKVNDLGKEDANMLIGAAAQMFLFGSLENRLQDMFGLDMIHITTGSIDPFERDTVSSKGMYNIEIGKYLFNDFMLVLTQGVNNDQQSIGVRYDLTQSTGINGWVNNRDNYYIGGTWRYRF